MFPIKWLVTCEFSYELYFGILFETFNYLLSKGGGGGCTFEQIATALRLHKNTKNFIPKDEQF